MENIPCTAKSSLLAQGKNPPETPIQIYNGRKVTDMNRVRDKQMIIRMTDTEVSEFDKKMKEARYKSRADFIMALLRNVKIIVPENFREIAVELKREGNNLNQAMKLYNKTKVPSNILKYTIESLNKVYSQLSAALEGMKNANIQSSGE
jgi:vancomycin resistance protein YoaR